MRVAAADVNVASIVVTLRGVLQQVDGADGKAYLVIRATRGGRGVGYVRGQNGAGDEADLWQRSSWANGSRPWRRVVDKVRPLQMNAVRSEIANFECRLMAQTFLHRTAPLLDVLRGCVGIHGSETYRRLT